MGDRQAPESSGREQLRVTPSAMVPCTAGDGPGHLVERQGHGARVHPNRCRKRGFEVTASPSLSPGAERSRDAPLRPRRANPMSPQALTRGMRQPPGLEQETRRSAIGLLRIRSNRGPISRPARGVAPISVFSVLVWVDPAPRAKVAPRMERPARIARPHPTTGPVPARSLPSGSRFAAASDRFSRSPATTSAKHVAFRPRLHRSVSSAARRSTQAFR